MNDVKATAMISNEAMTGTKRLFIYYLSPFSITDRQ
jgi:hypothetical protein